MFLQTHVWRESVPQRPAGHTGQPATSVTLAVPHPERTPDGEASGNVSWSDSSGHKTVHRLLSSEGTFQFT